MFEREAIVRVVKDDLDKGIDGSGSRSLVQECLALFRSQSRESRRQQYELNGIKEIRFSAPVSSQDAIRRRGKRMDFRLLPKGPKVRYRYLFDVHGCRCRCRCRCYYCCLLRWFDGTQNASGFVAFFGWFLSQHPTVLSILEFFLFLGARNCSVNRYDTIRNTEASAVDLVLSVHPRLDSGRWLAIHLERRIFSTKRRVESSRVCVGTETLECSCKARCGLFDGLRLTGMLAF
mmetsp:Transcript_16211/g.37352  ORF Transcript_16211/g.37352 Transcript_16211/m.37352 type:complete len:233 (-) Transcript_16211:138-836(-)